MDNQHLHTTKVSGSTATHVAGYLGIMRRKLKKQGLLRAADMQSMPALLKCLPGPFTAAEAAATCAAVAAFAIDCVAADLDRQRFLELVRDRDAWSTLLNLGILSPAAAAPVPYSLDGGASRGCLSTRGMSDEMVPERWTVRMLALAGACVLLENAQPGNRDYGSDLDRQLAPVVSQEVVQDALEFLAEQPSIAGWHAMKAMATADPQQMSRCLASLRPHLQRALAPFSTIASEPRLNALQSGQVIAAGSGLMMLFVTLHVLAPCAAPAPPDGRWDVLFLGLDALLLALAERQETASTGVGHSPTALGCLANFLQDRSEAAPSVVAKQLLERGCLQRWLQHLPRLPELVAEILLQASVALVNGRQDDKRIQQHVADLLPRVYTAVCSAAPIQKLQSWALSFLTEAIEAIAARKVPLQERQLPMLQHISAAVPWGRARIDAELDQALAYIAVQPGIALTAEQDSLAVAEAWAAAAARASAAAAGPPKSVGIGDASGGEEVFMTDGLHKLVLEDVLAPVAQQLVHMHQVAEASPTANHKDAAAAGFAWLLAVGRCIEAGPPAWVQGYPVTSEELWEFVAQTTRQRVSGQQLRRLYAGLEAKAQGQGSAGWTAAAARLAKKLMTSAEVSALDATRYRQERLWPLAVASWAEAMKQPRWLTTRVWQLAGALLQHPNPNVRISAGGALTNIMLHAYSVRGALWEEGQGLTIGEVLGSVEGGEGRQAGRQAMAARQAFLVMAAAMAELAAAAVRLMLRAEGYGLDTSQWDRSSSSYDEAMRTEVDMWIRAAGNLLDFTTDVAQAQELLEQWPGWGELRRWSLRQPAEQPDVAAAGRHQGRSGMSVMRRSVVAAFLQQWEWAAGGRRGGVMDGWLEELDRAWPGARLVLQQAAVERMNPYKGGRGSAGGVAQLQPGGGGNNPAAAGQASLLYGSCAHCGAVLPQRAAFRCSGCFSVRYCNSDCQRAGWKGHRAVCRQLRGVDAAR